MAGFASPAVVLAGVGQREVPTSCPICRKTTTGELYTCHICVHEAQFQAYARGDGTHGQAPEPFWHCDTCGFTFRPGEVLSPLIESRYSHDGRSDEDLLATIEAHYQDRLTSGKLKRLDWLETQCRFGKVLDVGTGHGELVKILRDRGYEATGIDPSKDRIRLANYYFGLAMQSGFYESSAYGADEFDLIIAECVLYRFPHPDVFFEAAWKHLRPGGAVFLVLPDVHLVQLNFLTNSVRCLFAPESMESLLASRGFRCQAAVTAEAMPESFQPGVFAVLAQKVEPSGLPTKFMDTPDRSATYRALLKQDYGLLRSRKAAPPTIALLKAFDDRRWFWLGRMFTRGLALAFRMAGARS